VSTTESEQIEPIEISPKTLKLLPHLVKLLTEIELAKVANSNTDKFSPSLEKFLKDMELPIEVN
jgi:hypothetical protein